MKRDNLAFLAGGIAFGVLLGYGLFHVLSNRPDTRAGGAGPAAPAASPAGPMSPTQMGQPAPSGGGGAPMLQEINALKTVLQANPDDLSALTRLANLYHDVAMYQQAIQFYEKAIEVSPGDPDLLTDLGTCYQAVGESQKALGLFEKAQRADPRHWQSLYNTVVVLAFNLGRLDEAEPVLRTLEERQPGLADVRDLRRAVEAARQQRSAPSP